MDLKLVKEFIELAKAEGLAELKYETKDVKLSVNLGGVAAMPMMTTAHAPVAVAASPSAAPVVNGEKFHEITSPFVGTFYSSSSPDKPAYAQVGQKVSKGQTLCILEAMKIMNEIESDVSGEIVEVCTDNESLVEFGQVMFKIRAN